MPPSINTAPNAALAAETAAIKDDRLTLIAIAALACILQDVLHEGLGHGATAWLSGAHQLTMSTVALQSISGAAGFQPAERS